MHINLILFVHTHYTLIYEAFAYFPMVKLSLFMYQKIGI